jgi:hypothetical protein
MIQGEYLHAKQNQFDANDMCLPLGDFFFFLLDIVHIFLTMTKRVDKGSF